MKKRLDILVAERNTSLSREKAKALIMAGEVFVDGEREDKAGTTFDESVSIEIKSKALPFVSRGGLKLNKAFDEFGLDVSGKVCTDVGASTGGFTDCLLSHGAKKVYAIDVGYGQLDWKLRNDERVVCLEKTNIRYLDLTLLKEPISFSSIDVSFISLTKVLPVVCSYLETDGEIVALIKPQFEAGREKVGKKGVVRDEGVHIEVLKKIISLAFSLELKIINIDFSPIKGPEGNIEYLLLLKKVFPFIQDACIINVDEIVKRAFTLLNRHGK
ncbi:MAG: TlyA family RNA methyltransferase [Lachnospiraceae bacterium]|jgi:23S rRNA (cytidine1920-2'-O)/16S rRNA (cytidine1409-2'-O)-methyltransferase|nr:TlyA family RNA methyltransferase [Lachnospiraceae bacterium]